VIVAHPDDGILGLGGQLGEIRPLTLVHVTDGTPRAADDARRAGFASRESYAQARARELDRALAAAGVRHARSTELGITDQEAVHHLADLVKLLFSELAQVDVVLTHPYEGGHPDHDACSFAVQAACTLLWMTGAAAPWRAEFACYHAHEGRLLSGTFWDAPGCPERVITLDAPQRARKRAALDEFVTQRALIQSYPLDVERLRRAPSYDFTQPPPPQEVLYEGHGCAISGSLWREQARSALRVLGLD
jgi:LmbE family N-acetylglucosaminyl deacetylase